MAEVILMPRLSDTMTEGVIAAWHKKVGDPVKKGDSIWMAPYCQQWFTAMGKEPAVYIYYKNVNRFPTAQ